MQSVLNPRTALRYFGRLVDPSVLRKGYGVLGLLIWAVNWLRIRLEAWLCVAVLKAELRESGLDKAHQELALLQAKADESIRPDFYNPPIEGLGQSSFRSTVDAVILSGREKRERSFTHSAVRPVPFEEGAASTFARYQARTDRAARYAVREQRAGVADQEHEIPMRDPELTTGKGVS